MGAKRRLHKITDNPTTQSLSEAKCRKRSLGAALLINSLLRTKGLFQTLYFLPYVTSTLAIGLVFRWLFHSEYGYINFFLEFLGLEPQKWLSDPNLTIVAVTIFTIWNGMAFKIVLFLAGLQKIDQQYYKAARIDGTPAHRIFFRITMPLLSPTFWMVTIVSAVWNCAVSSGLDGSMR